MINFQTLKYKIKKKSDLFERGHTYKKIKLKYYF